MAKLFKKKGFLVDKITEDSFYENLLLGLPPLLKACQFVSQIKLKHNLPATLEEVCQWESTNRLRLPEDLRNFYLSTNGFSFTYKFQYDKTDSEERNYILAGIEISSLSDLEKINGTDTVRIIEGDLRLLPAYSNVFLLAKLDDNNCVVLAQFNPTKPPEIWLYYNLTSFIFLCENFITYFRMAVAHVGVPGWQLYVLNANLPEWSAEMLQILAPGILNNHQLFENRCEQNKIDSEIFFIPDDLESTSEKFCSEEKSKRDLKKKTSGRSKPKK